MFDPKTNSADALAVLSDTDEGADLLADMADERTSRARRVLLMIRRTGCTIRVANDVERTLVTRGTLSPVSAA